MTISIKFLDGLYRRKHEHISAVGHYTEEVKKYQSRVLEAKTDKARKMAQHQLETWTRCLDGAKDRLLHIEVLIPEYIAANSTKG